MGRSRRACQLGVAYRHGDFVTKDVAKGVRFYEKAAMAVHMNARHNLAVTNATGGTTTAQSDTG